MTDLLLRKAQAGRAGAQGDEDYDVIGPDGIVIGRIFMATTSPGVGHRCGRWLTGSTRTERRRTDMRQHGTPPCRHSLGAGTERRDRPCKHLRCGQVTKWTILDSEKAPLRANIGRSHGLAYRNTACCGWARGG